MTLVNPKKKVKGRVVRGFSTLHPSEVQAARECGIAEANKIVFVSRLLDRIDNAKTVGDLRRCLSEFITSETNIT